MNSSSYPFRTASSFKTFLSSSALLSINSQQIKERPLFISWLKWSYLVFNNAKTLLGNDLGVFVKSKSFLSKTIPASVVFEITTSKSSLLPYERNFS